MRVAILHDYLNQFGGAERVLQAFLELFPEADLYTLLYDKKKTFGLFEGNIKKTSVLDHPFVRRRHRAFIPLMPFATWLLRHREPYDLVISSTAGYGKGIRVNAPYHISYCLSPLRYAWEIDYLKNLPFSPWPLTQGILHPIARWLRAWDKKAADQVNLFVADSRFIAEKVKSYYGREAQVVYPPVDTKVFYPEPTMHRKEYFLMVGRLLYYKGFDLGIKTFNRLKKSLKIIGSGPEMKKLRTLSDPRYIEFTPFISDDELRRMYSDAKALVFPQIEDFGLVAAEAQACGLPVVALNKGGGKEIVEHRRTGVLFNEQSLESLTSAIEDFERMSFDRSYIARRAKRFSKDVFKDAMRGIIREHGFVV